MRSTRALPLFPRRCSLPKHLEATGMADLCRRVAEARAVASLLNATGTGPALDEIATVSLDFCQKLSQTGHADVLLETRRKGANVAAVAGCRAEACDQIGAVII